MVQPRLTRRERLRVQTVRDIKDEALRQLSAGSTEAVTLSAIARALDMSVAGLYRYFASRDELLVALAGDSYRDFADALAAAVEGSHGTERLVRVVAAYRHWALAYSGRYRLMFASTLGTERNLPEIAHADRAMATLLDAVKEASGAPESSMVVARSQPELASDATTLTDQLTAWARRTKLPDAPPHLLLKSVALWLRLHGIVSLEIAGAWGAMRLEPELLIANELILLRDG